MLALPKTSYRKSGRAEIEPSRARPRNARRPGSLYIFVNAGIYMALGSLSFHSFSLCYLAFLLLMIALPALLLLRTSRPLILLQHHPQVSSVSKVLLHTSSRLHRSHHQRSVHVMAASPFSNPRSVVKKLLSKEQPEGDGALVRRSIGRPELKQLDPFLLLDEFSVSAPAGFPDHPHRGFETVTYMLEGAFTHQDFAGHKGTIKPGDLQWMTAGRGIVHCEMPAKKGRQHGLQLWVNLAAKDKMIDPNYQELEDKDIPKAHKDGVSVSVIAGESMGIQSPVYTRTPTMYLDFKLEAGAVLHQAVPDGWNAFVYILEGEASFGSPDGPVIGAHHTVQLGMGDGVSVWNNSKGLCRFVLIGGKPLNEPVVQYGPFVMNTREQVMQAIQDFQSGRNGFERAAGWQSDPVVVE